MEHYVLRTFSLFLMLLNSAVWSARNFEINFTKAECKSYDATLFSEYVCTLKPLPDAPKIIGVDSNFTVMRQSPKMTNKIIVDIMRPGTDEVIFKLVDAEFNVCKFLDQEFTGNIFAIYLKTMKAYSNEMPKCPFKLNFAYQITNFHFSPDDFPPFSPDASVRAKLDFYEDNKLVASQHSWMDVTNKKVLKNLKI